MKLTRVFVLAMFAMAVFAEETTYKRADSIPEDIDAEREFKTLESEKITYLNDETFEHLTQAATGATTGAWGVMFAKRDCPHSKSILPIFRATSRELNKQMSFAIVFLEDSPQLHRRFNIDFTPALALFNHGQWSQYPFREKPRTYSELVKFFKGQDETAKTSKVPPPPGLQEYIMEEGQKIVGVALRDAHEILQKSPWAVAVLACLGFFSAWLLL